MRSFTLLFSAALLSLVLWACNAHQSTQVSEDQPLHQRVDPFVGTGGHGHTYPGATSPFGMVQLSPDTRLDGWDGCGGYHFSDSIIYGFSHTHLQGTGVSDYGDILFAPTNSTTKNGDNWGERYCSAFSHSTETAEAGYYSVHLDDHALQAEFTTTPHVGIHHYTLDNEQDSITLFIDMAHRDEMEEYSLFPQGDSLIVGHRISRNWAEEQHIYFVAQFSEPFEFLDQTYEVEAESVNPETGQLEQTIQYVPVFPLVFQKGAKELTIKVGMSMVGNQEAMDNLFAEADHWDFDRYRQEGQAAWDSQLSKVSVSGGTPDQQRNFYSALYHSNTVPNIASDVSGSYRGTDLQVHTGDGTPHYTVFSLWDTFRATHPQLTITEPERTQEFVHSFLRMYQEGGQLPIWELSGNYTGCMIGYHSVPVIVDAYFKGLADFDHQLALEAMVQIADSVHLGKPAFAEQGFIPSEVEHESVSKGLEYAYDDWCIARFAEALGEQATAERFYARSLNYRNIINCESGFAQPRRNGGWADSFDPYEVNFNFTEANSYQYSFFVPHDIEGHIAHVGGPARYEMLLDSLFLADEQTTGRQQADITGLIGQYAHGNEPSHHMAWLYHYLGKPYKSTELVHRILNELYTPTPDGLCGNEDCGQMSSWYVLSSMGLYPVNPASPEYLIGAPLFDEGVFHQTTGDFTITTIGAGMPYVQSVKLNGVALERTFITHQEIAAGGTLEITCSDTANEAWGQAPEHRPRSLTDQVTTCAAPVLVMERVYEDSVRVELRHPDPNATFTYSHKQYQRMGSDGMGLQLMFPLIEEEKTYTGPFYLSGEYVTIEAVAETNGVSSPVVAAEAHQHTSTMGLHLVSEYANQYTAGGETALIDGLRGGHDFRTGEWQGYWGVPVEFILDLQEEQTIYNVKLGVLQDAKPWIFYPEEVSVEISDDGQNWAPYGYTTITVPKDDFTPQFMNVTIASKPLPARYVKVIAHGLPEVPDWHLGAGGKPWIFVDEVTVNQ